jgi:hypothetical protein
VAPGVGRHIPAVGRNCAEGGQQEATGGTVIYTTVTDTLMAANYDLLFGKSRVLGSFPAPTYVLCVRARRRGRASSSSKVKVISPMGKRQTAPGRSVRAPGRVGGRFRPPSEDDQRAPPSQ